jgi:hypothetical protein
MDGEPVISRDMRPATKWERRLRRGYELFLDVGVSLLPIWLLGWVFVAALGFWLYRIIF